MRITIIGGHGKIALLAAPLLAAAGHHVRGIIRNEAHAADVRAAGAEPVVADVEQLDMPALASLVHGEDAVVWSAGAGGGDPARTYAVDRDAAIRSIAAASAAGVRRFVMVSYFGAGPDHGVPEGDAFHPYAHAKSAADEALANSDLDWVLLRPSRLTLDEPSGRIEARQLDASVRKGSIARGNVAALIAAAIERPTLARVTVECNDGATPIGAALDTLGGAAS